MKLNERFTLQEYVPKSVYEKHGERAVRFISTTLIDADFQLLKDLEVYYGRPISCTINSWSYGGNRQYSGLRVEGEPYYRPHSLHSMGSASDKLFKFKDGDKESIPTKDVYGFIIDNQEKYYAIGMRRMEDVRDASSWIHWDTCWTSDAFKNKIQIVRA